MLQEKFAVDNIYAKIYNMKDKEVLQYKENQLFMKKYK
jgi:hypothetical protein